LKKYSWMRFRRFGLPALASNSSNDSFFSVIAPSVS
jgi:hypothetical protein